MVSGRVQTIDNNISASGGANHIACLAIIVSHFPTGIPECVCRAAADLAGATQNKNCLFHVYVSNAVA
ncbi:hypothetical protein RCCS2_13569 [Roseobacter sp. CCS2]|nr:hypothetical protein RCCS2_13569 [Roseobacter sp. CCS2]